MNEIAPEDIREAAMKVADSCSDDYYWQRIFNAAVRALMDERERCAKIAEKQTRDGQPILSSQWIASIIRNGDT